MFDDYSLPVFESFLVRFWQERASHAWRGRVIHISSQETCDFATWDQAKAFFRRFVLVSITTQPPEGPMNDDALARETDAAALPQADSLLEMLDPNGRDGAACALLTPAIKARLRELAPGQVLEVRVNDPTARLDVEAWCQLSGNPLIAITEEAPDVLRFFVRKKPSVERVE